MVDVHVDEDQDLREHHLQHVVQVLQTQDMQCTLVATSGMPLKPKGLVTYNGEGGGHVKFCPYEKSGGRGGKSLSHAEGGHTNFWGSVNMEA